MASKIGVALIGLGRIGQIHAKHMIISPRISLKWIVENELPNAEQWVSQYDLKTRCTTSDGLGRVLSDSETQAVVICTPSDTHETLIQRALHAGKSVMCEKPITTDLETTQKCFELAESMNKPLLCAFNRRFDPSFRKVRDAVHGSCYGTLRNIRITSRDQTPPPISYIQSSGGIFSDSTIHDLDMSTWISGSRPVSVYAKGVAFDPEIRRCGDYDQVFVAIEYENCALSIIDNGRMAAYGYDQRLEVLCESGMLSVENKVTNLTTEHGRDVTSVPRIDTQFTSRYMDAYWEELQHFIDILQGKQANLVTKDDTLTAMRLAEACKVSAKSGSRVTV
ncbi:hypothetical protein ScPMuIL_007970 [Solemya velum]